MDHPASRASGPHLRRCGRWLRNMGLIFLVLVTVVVVVLKVWLPSLGDKKAEIETYLSQKSNRPVRIGKLEAYWHGLYPRLLVEDLYLLSEDGRKIAIRLDAVKIRVATLPLLIGELVLDDLILVRPSLQVTRLEDGSIEFGDITPSDRGKDNIKGTGGKSFVNWLFRQNKILIEDGEVMWVDKQSGGLPINLSSLTLKLENDGSHHRFNGSAQLIDVVSESLSVSADIEGIPLIDTDWRGKLDFEVATLDIDRLPKIIREQLPRTLTGKINAKARFLWAAGRLERANGAVGIKRFKTDLDDLRTPFQVKNLEGHFLWQRESNGWQFDIDHLNLWFEDKPWSAGHLRAKLRSDKKELSFHVDRVRVQDMVALINKLRSDSKPVRIIQQLQPGGEVRDLRLLLKGGWKKPEAFQLDARLVNASVLPYKKFPGVRGANGLLSLHKTGGRFELDTKSAMVEFPRLFEQPLPVGFARGEIIWKKSSDHWQVTGKKLAVGNEDGQGTGKFEARVPFDRSISPYLFLEAAFSEGDVSHASRYIPSRRLRPKTVRWLNRAIIAGKVVNGSLYYKGNVREWPFINRPGEFKVHARVTGGVLDYAPGWPKAEQANADLLFEKAGLLVTGSHALVNGLSTSNVNVRINNFKDPKKVIKVSGRLEGGFDRVVEFLQSGPLFKKARVALAAMSGRGQGVLDISVEVPIKNPKASRVSGRYMFNNAALRLGGGIEISGLTGPLSFSETEVRSGSLPVKVLGGKALLSVSTPRPGLIPTVVVNMSGRVRIKNLDQLLGKELVAPLNGEADWHGSLRLGEDGGELSVASNLYEVYSTAPAPLDKAAGDVWPLRVKTRFHGGTGRDVSFRIHDRLNGQLWFRRQASEAVLERGQIVVGSVTAKTTREKGVGLHVALDEVDLDKWLAYLKPITQRSNLRADAGISRLSSNVGTLRFFDRQFSDVHLSGSRDKYNRWQGSISAAEIAGDFDFLWGDAKKQLELQLEHLYWAKGVAETGKTTSPLSTAASRSDLPELKIQAQRFRYGDLALGKMELSASPIEHGWRVEKFDLSKPHSSLSAYGQWQTRPDKGRSQYHIEMKTTDIGKSLQDWSLPGQVEGGHAKLQVDLDWSGGLQNFNLDTVNASIQVDASQGRFPKVDPGAGRFLGLFNLDALARRLRLDFTDVFSKGFAFDRISGGLQIENGTAYTQDLSLLGPTADIRIVGRSGIVTEDYDLELTVIPRLGGNLAIAGSVLGSPATGAAIFLFQKVFKKQLSGLVKYHYVVTGPWDDPAMTRVESHSQG